MKTISQPRRPLLQFQLDTPEQAQRDLERIQLEESELEDRRYLSSRQYTKLHDVIP